MTFILLLFLILQTAIGYSIQGNWTFVAGRGITLGNETVTLGIEDYIFKGQQILQKLTFVGCKNLMLQASISENQLFINFNSYYTQARTNITCVQKNSLDQIYSKLTYVFSFKITADELSFNDPFGSSLMTFKRVPIKKPDGIVGTWSMNQYGTVRTSLSVQISDTQITLCQGNLVYNYSLVQDQYVINLTPVKSACPAKDLILAVTATKYFRNNNGTLNFYNSSVAMAAQLTYSSPYDPSKSIFGSAQAPTNATKAPNALISSNSTPRANASQSPSGVITTSNLVGRWSVVSLFNIPFPSSPYTLTFTSSSIQLNGGCNSFTYIYSINSSSQLITLGNSTSTNKSCGQSDDQLYVSGITKMNKYLLSNTNGIYTLRFYDQTGNSGYLLQINQSSLSKASPTQPQKAAPPTPAPTPAPVQPLASGKYLLLLLQRRDLPRVLVNITKNTLIYKSCNSIQQVFLPAQLTGPKSSISFSGGPTSNSTCKPNNDEIYYGTINLAKSFSFDVNAGTVILSNAAGIEIATLSQTG